MGAFQLINASSGSFDLFVTKITDSGSTSSFTWAKRAGGTGYDTAGPLVVEGSVLYLTGTFEGTTAAPAFFGTTPLISAGNTDGFVTKIVDTGTDGVFGWANRLGGADNEQVKAVAVAGNAVYVGGNFSSPTANFGSTSLANAGAASGPASTDAFVTKLTDAGSAASFAWAQRAGGPGNDDLIALAIQGAGLYLTGTFEGSSASVGTTPLASAGSIDGFVAALVDAGPTSRFAWAQAVGGPNYDYIGGLSLTGTTVYVGGGIYSGTSSFPPRVVSNPSSNFAAFLASFAAPVLTTTIPAALAGPAFTLAPNPARTAATLTLPALPGTATATLTLRDALGRTVRTETVALPLTGLRHELDLSGLPAGIYAVQVQAGKATATRRLVVE
ncbi:T9SS type A sorting domain-containing protein [Hymenobacter siberiensis]|uniref:T9SS type A sorting domain-containing protein n=1 Tax=Hymenobacter siberiensis TaxID=2848396 RepID=UPI001C1E09EA